MAAPAAVAMPLQQQQQQSQPAGLPPTPLSQLMATAASLETDLRNLCSEARRKYPELQTSAERAIVKLRALQSHPQPTVPSAVAAVGANPAPKTPVEVLQSESVLRPLLLACGSKSPRLSTLALASAQRLVSLQPLSGRFVSTVMGALRIQAESDDPSVQLKVLQTLLLCISPAAVECGELLRGSLLQALSVTFRLLLQRKSPQIHHTAQAALRQLVTLLVDRVTWQSQQGRMWLGPRAAGSAGSADQPSVNAALLPPPLDQLSYEAQNAYLLFQDLCILSANGVDVSGAAAASAGSPSPSPAAAASSTRPRWLTNSSSIAPEICLELLENIVSSASKLFAAQPILFANLIKRDLCGLLMRLLRSTFDFAGVLRIVRNILVLIKLFHASLVAETDCFLSLFIRMLAPEFPLWHRVVVLEAIHTILSLNQGKFAYWVYAQYDAGRAATNGAGAAQQNQTRIFTSLIHALSRIVIQTGSALSDGAGGGSTPNSAGSSSGLLSGGGGSNLQLSATGLSNSLALIAANAPAPVVSVTVPSSPQAGTASPLPFGLGGAGVGGRAGLDSLAGFSSSASSSSATLSWRLYQSKGNRGLDLLNLDQTAGQDGGSAGSSSGANTVANALYEESYIVTLGIECIICVVNGLAALAKTNEKWGGSHAAAAAANGAGAGEPSSTAVVAPADSVSPVLDASLTPIDPSLLRAMATAGCMPILAALSFLLNKSLDESQIQHLLMSYQSFTNTAGVLELTKSRDAFLVNLCGFALPKNGLPRDDPPSELIRNLFGITQLQLSSGAGGLVPSASSASAPSVASSSLDASSGGRVDFLSNLPKILLSAKNIQALKALFNISHCLGSYLGASSWLTVLETFQTLDTMIHIATELHYRLSRDHGHQELAQSLLPHQTEINIMAAALGRLFESTRFLDDQAVTHVLSALGTLSLSALANAATSEGGADSRSGASQMQVPLSSLLSGGGGGSGGSGSGVGSSLSLTPPQTIRMFALINLIATLEHNMYRITSARLWEIGIGHLTCVINHKDALIRGYGVAALTKITILALGKPSTYVQSPAVMAAAAGANAAAPAAAASSAAMSASAPASASAKRHSSAQSWSELSPTEFHSFIQGLLLDPFSDLFRSKYEDTREAILVSLLQILQNCGQCLVKGGWKVVLAILQQVVQGNVIPVNSGVSAAGENGTDEPSSSSAAPSRSTPPPSLSPPASASASASFINIGFNSVQLITNDYLESIPLSSLSNLIQTIAAYCAQTSDTNISFTSIGLLWRVSDYLQKLCAQGQAKKVDPAAANGATSTADPAVAASAVLPDAQDVPLSDALADSLMHYVFTSLASLSTDTRTEVRNSAVKTLHSTLVAHAARMSLATCVHNLSTLVLPLLHRLLVEKSLEDSLKNSALNSTELGKDKTTGKSVMMLIHYSRDTAGKQWDETRVYALQGTARVVKGYVDSFLKSAAASPAPALVAEAFQAQWMHYLDLNLIALSNRSSEVTLSALNAVLELVSLLFAQPMQSALAANAGATLSSSSSTTPAAVAALWQPVLERFYLRGVLHALLQHRHLEWVEEQERAFEVEKKLAKATGAPVPASTGIDHAASPFRTALGDVSSEDGWKSWLKTYTHLLGNFQAIMPAIRRSLEAAGAAPQRDDLNILLHLSHTLVAVHGAYTEQRARQLFAQRRQSSGNTSLPSPDEISMVDRKETPLQAAHLKLLESLCATVSPANGASSLSSALWDSVFDQLLSYLVSASAAELDLAAVEQQLQSMMAGQLVRSNSMAVVQSMQHRRSSATAPALQFASSSFAKKVLRVLDRLFCSSSLASSSVSGSGIASVSPALTRAQKFPQILLVLQKVLAGSCKWLGEYEGLAEEAVACCIHILEAGMGCMNDRVVACNASGSSAEGAALAAEVWDTIVLIFATFLAPPNVQAALLASTDESAADVPQSTTAVLLPLRPELSASAHRVWENIQIAMVGCLVRIVLPHVSHVPSPRTVHRIVGLFNITYAADEEEQGNMIIMQGSNGSSAAAAAADSAAGVSLAPAPNELLSHSCLMALFHLVRSGASVPETAYSNHLGVARLAAPLLMRRCEEICETYLALERLHPPSVPLPRCRREEIGFVLRELCTLEMQPEVASSLFPQPSPAGASKGPSVAPSAAAAHLATGRRAHLLKLFPVLCKCITMRESDLRELLRDVFQLASAELGMQ